MTERITMLIEELGLKEHPEGGYYSEMYRSVKKMEFSMGRRNLMTSIYFLLPSDNVSRFHRIKSDELWFFHEGDPLSIHTLSEGGYEKKLLGPVSASGHRPFQIVPAGVIFGSTVDGEESYSLVSCVVAPGFDFRDFELMEKKELLEKWPDQSLIIRKLA